MLERGIWDSLSFYPFALWPIAFQVLTFLLYKFNRDAYAQGFDLENLYSGQFDRIIAFAFFPFLYLFGVFSFVCGFVIFGWIWLLSIPISAALAFALIFVLRHVPFTQYVLPVSVVLMALMTLVLFGVFHLQPFKTVNEMLLKVLG